MEGTQVYGVFLKLYMKFQGLMDREEGQDLVEYAMIVALIALAAVTGVKALAGGVNSAFNTISTTFTHSI